jgi:hypothetical protein
MPLAPQKQYAANIASVVRALTRSRANAQLLHEPEWKAYEEAIASGRCPNARLCLSCDPPYHELTARPSSCAAYCNTH